MADTAVATPEVTEKVEEVEKVEKVETEKKVEESADEPSIAENVNGHSKEAAEEPSENGTAEEEAEEKEAESTENGTSEVTKEVTKRKSSGGDETSEAAPEGVSPEKKAKLADAEEKEASNGTVEAETTA